MDGPSFLQIIAPFVVPFLSKRRRPHRVRQVYTHFDVKYSNLADFLDHWARGGVVTTSALHSARESSAPAVGRGFKSRRVHTFVKTPDPAVGSAIVSFCSTWHFLSPTMYADREEAVRRSMASDPYAPAPDAAERERQLHEQLRRRAADSRRRDEAYDVSGDARRASRRRGDDAYDNRDYGADHMGDRERDDRYYSNVPPPPAAGRYRGGRRRHDDYDARRRSRSPPATRIRGRANTEYEGRSVFCSLLDPRVGQRDLGEFFEDSLGRDSVFDVRIYVDFATGESKRVGYVELAREDLVPRALELTGKHMFGKPVLVQPAAEARNNSIVQSYTVPRAPPPAAAVRMATEPRRVGTAPVPTRAPPVNPEARLHVGNLHFDITAHHVRAVFEPFGAIDDADVLRDAHGRSKGSAFVQYRSAEDARQAMEQLNGFELAGRAMRVHFGQARGGGGTGFGGRQGSPPPRLPREPPNNAERRHAVMEKLAGLDPSTTTQVRPASIPDATSPAILLKYMFNPAEYVLAREHI